MRSEMCERFCGLVAAGNTTQADAYVRAGYSGGGTRRNVVKRASSLARRHAAHIEELKKKRAERQEAQLLWTRQDAIKALKRAAEDCSDEEGRISDKKTYISAISELNKICGYYTDTKKDGKAQGSMAEIDIDAIMQSLGYKND